MWYQMIKWKINHSSFHQCKLFKVTRTISDKMNGKNAHPLRFFCLCCKMQHRGKNKMSTIKFLILTVHDLLMLMCQDTSN
jgi:hypothetical protein